MAKKRIFTVGFPLPGSEFEHVAFDSDQTLLNADIVVFRPSLQWFSVEKHYNGRPLLTDHSSFLARQRVSHWRSEIEMAVNAGKLVIVYLARPDDYYYYTGERRHSGTGRSRVSTNVVAEITSYSAIPIVKRATPKSGTEMRLETAGQYLASYWSEFSKHSPYEVEIEGEFNRVVLRSRAGDRIVGAASHSDKGTILFLPPLALDGDEFTRDAEVDEDVGEYWTKEALTLGKRLAAALVGLSDRLSATSQSTPPPAWALTTNYRLEAENHLQAAITVAADKIAQQQERKSKLETELGNVGSLRRLLFEQGKPLEAAVLQAMKILGFKADRFADGQSEFDGLFLSAEGRCLGEVEGKDNKAINIEKFSQLERNLQEDFARDELSEHAKGVLFGNAFRLKSPVERGDFFTEKCVSAARRIQAALVKTTDLFVVAKYVKEQPTEAKFAKSCREAIFAAAGTVVVFPTPPAEGPTTIAEVPQEQAV